MANRNYITHQHARTAGDTVVPAGSLNGALVAGEFGVNLTLADALEKQLALVDSALARMTEGSYGTCSVCGNAIEPERLEAIPATDRCIQHA